MEVCVLALPERQFFRFSVVPVSAVDHTAVLSSAFPYTMAFCLDIRRRLTVYLYYLIPPLTLSPVPRLSSSLVLGWQSLFWQFLPTSSTGMQKRDAFSENITFFFLPQELREAEAPVRPAEPGIL
jgi:hypothetical protein